MAPKFHKPALYVGLPQDGSRFDHPFVNILDKFRLLIVRILCKDMRRISDPLTSTLVLWDSHLKSCGVPFTFKEFNVLSSAYFRLVSRVDVYQPTHSFFSFFFPDSKPTTSHQQQKNCVLGTRQFRLPPSTHLPQTPFQPLICINNPFTTLASLSYPCAVETHSHVQTTP